MNVMTIITEAKLESQTSAQKMGWPVLRIVLGLVILTAAFLKAHQLSVTPIFGEGLLHARWFNILVVEFELFFGIWLLVGRMPKVTWLASIGCFTAFAGVSLYKAVTGEASCGCWGVIDVNPWYTLTFDSIVIGLLIVFRPKVKWTFGLNIAKKQVLNYCLIVVPIGFFLLWSISQVEFHQLREVGQVLEQGSIIKLGPGGWVDKKFPLRDHCDSRFAQTECLLKSPKLMTNIRLNS